MARIGQLFVELSLKASDFTAGLKQAQKDAKELEKSIRPIKDALTDVGAGMTAIGGAVTASFLVMAKQAADFGDAIRDASIRTGISTEALSGLKFAAEQTGTSFEGVQVSLKKLAVAASTAAAGTKETANAFKSIGVSVKDATGHLRPMESILGDVAEKFSKMSDGTEKAALAAKLFGKNGVAMIEFLNQGKEGIAAFQKQTEALNAVIGPEFAKASDDFKDSISAMGTAQLGLSVAIGQALLPLFTKVSDTITGLIAAFAKFTAAHPDLTRAVFVLAATLSGAGGLILGLAGVLAILPALTAAFALLATPIGIVVVSIGALGAAMLAFPKFGAFVVTWAKNFIGAITAVSSGIVSLGDILAQVSTGQFGKAWQTMKDAPGLAAASAQEAIDSIDRTINSLSDTIASLKITTSASAKTFKGEFEPALIDAGDAADKAAKKLQELVQSARVKLASELPTLIDNINYSMERSAKEFSQLLADKISLLESKLKFLDQAAKAFRESSFRAQEQLMNDLDRVTKQTVSGILDAQKKAEEAAKKQAEGMKQAVNDVKQSAGKVFDDMFIKGENVFTSLKNLLKGGALSLGRTIFEDIAGALLGPIKKAFDDFFSGLLEGVGLKSLISGLGQKLGGALSSIIPGGGAVEAVTGGAATAARGAGGAASSAAGGASAFAGLGASLIGGVVSGAISALGSARQEGTLNAVEANTRFTYIELRDLINQIAWPLLNQTNLQTEMMAYQSEVLAAMELETQGILNKGTGAATTGPLSFTINVTAPLTIAPQFTVEGGDISTLTIRDRIVPETIKMIDTNVRGYGERLAQIIRDRLDGLTGTQAPVGI